MKNWKTILQWVLIVYIGISLITAVSVGSIIGAILSALAGVLILPVPSIQRLRQKFHLGRKRLVGVVAICLVASLIFTGMNVDPPTTLPKEETTSQESSETSKGADDAQQEETESHSSESSSETSSKPSEETSTPNKPSEESTSNTPTKKPETTASNSVGAGKASPVNLKNIPAYSNKPYVTVNGNTPNFSAAELTTVGYEKYSSLDSKGRCGAAVASCGREIMPAEGEERGNISSIKPTGWIQAKYSGISGGYLWNRCHLIGWQLSAENANRQNLITGTRYMNVDGMLPFENMVADYIKETGNHVAYRITPIFEGNNLVCSGVQMEAYSIEDNGEGICFNVYCYNVQPGISINYATGASSEKGSSANSGTSSNTGSTSSSSSSNTGSGGSSSGSGTSSNSGSDSSQSTSSTPTSQGYVLNTNSKKFHKPSCYQADRIKDENRATSSDSRESLIDQGYSPCGTCKP